MGKYDVLDRSDPNLLNLGVNPGARPSLELARIPGLSGLSPGSTSGGSAQAPTLVATSVAQCGDMKIGLSASTGG